MKLEDYLEKESENRKFKWQDVSKWSVEQLRDAWMQTGQSLMKPKETYKDLDPKLTDDLIYYLLRDDRFSKDLNKGILIVGPSGTGKTRYTEIFCLLLGYLHNKKSPSYTGKQMEFILRLPSSSEKVINLWSDALEPTFNFEDIGEENDKTKSMGTDINIGVEILGARSLEYTSKGSLTIGTSNLTPKDMERKYGARIDSRLFEMFNGFSLEGDDMRKKK